MGRFPVVCCLALALALPVSSPAGAQDMGLYGWGPRAGVGDDPDQGIVGFHLNLGELVDNLRFQPSFEVGFGDDTTIVSLQLPVHYRFPVSARFVPYAGGGVNLAFIDFDERPPGRRGDDSETELAPVAVGGIEWPLGRGSDVFLELNVLGGDAHDAKLLVGWMLAR